LQPARGGDDADPEILHQECDGRSGLLLPLQVGAPPGKRREVFIGGRRVTTGDIHAHCFVPEVCDLVKDTPLAANAKNNLTGNIASAIRSD
jgi:predicted amidohydrolase